MKTRVNVSRMRKVRLLLRAAAGVVVTAILIAVALHLFFSKIAQVQMPMGLLQ